MGCEKKLTFVRPASRGPCLPQAWNQLGPWNQLKAPCSSKIHHQNIRNSSSSAPEGRAKETDRSPLCKGDVVLHYSQRKLEIFMKQAVMWHFCGHLQENYGHLSHIAAPTFSIPDPSSRSIGLPGHTSARTRRRTLSAFVLWNVGSIGEASVWSKRFSESSQLAPVGFVVRPHQCRMCEVVLG